MPTARSKYDWNEWLESVKSRRIPKEVMDGIEPSLTRTVYYVSIGESLGISDSSPYPNHFYSSNYNWYDYWQSSSGEYPLRRVLNKGRYDLRFAEQGILHVYEYLNGKMFIDAIFICIF